VSGQDWNVIEANHHASEVQTKGSMIKNQIDRAYARDLFH
jgi:hypothetical protein